MQMFIQIAFNSHVTHDVRRDMGAKIKIKAWTFLEGKTTWNKCRQENRFKILLKQQLAVFKKLLRH
jgi:hypothetical protein